jgi:hypothetical protein
MVGLFFACLSACSGYKFYLGASRLTNSHPKSLQYFYPVYAYTELVFDNYADVYR